MLKTIGIFLSALLMFFVFAFYRHPVPEGSSLSEKYPNDIGIESDPTVLFTEMFEDSLTGIFKRYSDVKNGKGMYHDNDKPEGSRGSRSLKLTSVGGISDGGHLFYKVNPGWDSTIYVRYYVKYPSISKGHIHHEAIKIGGNNPPLDYHKGLAGICGLGNKRFSIAYEPNKEPEMDTYLYWGDMKSWNGGTSCYGNTLVNHTPKTFELPWDKWMCVEIMVKLNNPVTASNGELRIWQDGQEVGYWGENFPGGYWKGAGWVNDPKGQPFKGFRWRTDSLLNINFLRIEHYDDTSPNGEEHYVKYDHVVVATKYIGPMKKK